MSRPPLRVCLRRGLGLLAAHLVGAHLGPPDLWRLTSRGAFSRASKWNGTLNAAHCIFCKVGSPLLSASGRGRLPTRRLLCALGWAQQPEARLSYMYVARLMCTLMHAYCACQFRGRTGHADGACLPCIPTVNAYVACPLIVACVWCQPLCLCWHGGSSFWCQPLHLQSWHTARVWRQPMRSRLQVKAFPHHEPLAPRGGAFAHSSANGPQAGSGPGCLGGVPQSRGSALVYRAPTPSPPEATRAALSLHLLLRR